MFWGWWFSDQVAEFDKVLKMGDNSDSDESDYVPSEQEDEGEQEVKVECVSFSSVDYILKLDG